MDIVKTKKLTSLISKLTDAANKAIKKHEPSAKQRNQFSITGFNNAINSNGNASGFRPTEWLRN